MSVTIKCLDCKRVLNESPRLAESERTPCPACGSLSRQIEPEWGDNVGLHDILKGKGKHGGRGKPYIEITVGGDVFRKTSKWMRLERSIDRDNDWYEEIVIDPETGEITHKCAEPLSKHMGHGSAKERGKGRNA